MDEEVSIIDANTRNEKIKNFYVNNKKSLFFAILLIILLIFSYFIYSDLQKKNKIKIANKYNFSVINFELGNKSNTENEMIEIIKKKDKTY